MYSAALPSSLVLIFSQFYFFQSSINAFLPANNKLFLFLYNIQAFSSILFLFNWPELSRKINSNGDYGLPYFVPSLMKSSSLFQFHMMLVDGK